MTDSRKPADVFFDRSCPVCGRMLRIRVQLLGRRVYCQHCGGGFTAIDEGIAGETPVHDRVEDLIARASQVLAQASADGDDDAAFSG